jgi:RND family efflux transporter MFP subunit
MNIRIVMVSILAAAHGLLTGCGATTPKETKSAPAPAAKVENRIKEADLTRVTLSPDAERRLGIEIAAAVERTGTDRLTTAGEIVAIPGRTLVVAAPSPGRVVLERKDLAAGQSIRKGQAVFRLTPMLAPQRDLKITYEAEVKSAKTRLDAATQQLERASQLLRDMAGSKRNVEAAEQEFGQAKAAHDAAVERLERLESHPLDGDVDMTIVSPSDGIIRQLQAAEGQNVTSGAALFEVADFSTVWLRVPIYAGDLNEIGPVDAVDVRDVDGTGAAMKAHRVAAPPTADPLAVTTDLYFEVANPGLRLRPGQRMLTILPLRTASRKGLSVPLSALIYDTNGGTWVYVVEAPRVYRRQRVELRETLGAAAFLSRGVVAGTNVVAQGAAELYGTEFGAGH